MLLRASLVVCLVGTSISACSVGTSPIASAAAKDVKQRSESAGLVMARVRRSESVLERARKVLGDTGQAKIELLEAEGTGIDGHLVLRISVSIPEQGFSSGSSATACFRYDMTDRSGGTDPDEVRCPGGAPIVLPPPIPVPTMPADGLQRLETALRSKDPEAALRRAFANTGMVLGFDTSTANVGASVLAGRDQCFFGRKLPNGQVEVWVVPRVVAQPGELGCGARFAAQGDGKTSPH